MAPAHAAELPRYALLRTAERHALRNASSAMKNMQVVRQSVDDEAVDSGMPWRVYVVEDFAFAENDDDLDAADLDVFVDPPDMAQDTDVARADEMACGEADTVRGADLPHVAGAVADLRALPANDDKR